MNEVLRPGPQESSLLGISQRLPPSNMQAEQALLGALLANNRAYERVSEFLVPEHFAHPAHGRIFQAISRRVESGQLADAVMLRAEFEHSGLLDEVGGAAYLAQLLSAMVGIINAGEYGRAIHDAWLRRQMIDVGERVVNGAFCSDLDMDAAAQLDAAKRALDDLSMRTAVRANDLGIWDAGEDDYAVPPRGWLLGTAFCRRFVSSMIADGGVGKTALRLAQLISLALGRPLTGEHVFCRCRVLVLSLEDDRDELRRRVNAVLRHHGIAPQALKGWLYLAAPKGLRLAEMRDGSPQAGALESMLRRSIAKHRIDIVSIDPFVKSHALEENNNAAIDFVCTQLAQIAIEHDCGVDLPHHTSKGLATAGDANRGRGASAMKDAARLVYTLTPMSAEEAAAFGIADQDRRSLVRLDSGKVNIAPPSREARWFRLIGVPLGNGTGQYPNGDEVQTVEPWTPPRAKVASLTDLDSLTAAIGRGTTPAGEPWSPKLSQDDRSIRALFELHGFIGKDAQKPLLARLQAEHEVEIAEYKRPTNRGKASGLRVGGRPSAEWMAVAE